MDKWTENQTLNQLINQKNNVQPIFKPTGKPEHKLTCKPTKYLTDRWWFKWAKELSTLGETWQSRIGIIDYYPENP